MGEREFALAIGPEHAPPINPSPWYAFRYRTVGDQNITVRLDYIDAKHRYRPKLSKNGTVSVLGAQVSEAGRHARLTLPAGGGIVSGQEIFGQARYDRLLDRLAKLQGSTRLTLGRSLDGRPLKALLLGSAKAPYLVVLIGRQHPPEVTGALAMEAFLHELAAQIAVGEVDLDRYRFLIVPMLNPDGVYHGHWRANRGGQDLNRDWGHFTQPETQAVRNWLNDLSVDVCPIAMVDFHSTGRNLFYVQGKAETDAAQEAFLSSWLGRAGPIPGYDFTIERRNANPGSGTSKNWFHQRYGIPAYTYEVGDETDRTAIARSASLLARRFIPALVGLPGDTASRCNTTD
ncbi:hypothetical protein GRI58_12100 [Porphyrobacter algicida]|uniref:Peptidase M14 domain-containing protein n=1 Tax=Qipengyuania algicida TaxID=1836209 RepID=A0A845AL03_9SPHN|nr:M14 family metallopeptidase [Qipengyuania algicida]MXP29561.1 hypothetical protein [Qipengyuania algicida]